MANHKILIVEDQVVIAEQLRYFLEKYGFSCKHVDTGEETLQVVEQFLPDVILMDIFLAGPLNGIETTTLLKTNHDIPIIYLTSHIDEEIIKSAIKTNPSGFVSKTISHSELKVQIDYVMQKHNIELEQKKTLKTLESTSQKYQNIFNSSRDAIFYVDKSMAISFWNPSAERIFGYSFEEVKGSNIADIILTDEFKNEFKQSFLQWVDGEDNPNTHYVFNTTSINKHGRVFPCEISLGLICDDDYRSVCGFARDISEKVVAEEEIGKLIEEMQISKDIIEQNANEVVQLNFKLVENDKKLTELNRSKDRFFSIIAHDLKGPFQGLLGYSQILSRDLMSLELDEVSELAQNLHQSASQLFKLLENLLNWSRIQRGIIEYTPLEFDLNFLATQTMELNKARADQKQIVLEMNVPQNSFVHADINMINTILRNLVSNAIKFTPKDGVVAISSKVIEYNMIEVTVRDSGVGIAPEKLERLFRIDEYHSTPGTDNEQGTGLGLILCKELVEYNHGTIRAVSTSGKGTDFIFTLPIGNENE